MKKILLIALGMVCIGSGCSNPPGTPPPTDGTTSPISTPSVATTTAPITTRVDRYLSNNPEACKAMKFTCQPGEQYFINSGGCGCQMDTSTLPVTPPKNEDDQTMCYDLYKPVCAEKTVYCIKAPCPPIRQTYSNDCYAKRDGATNVQEGACIEK
jgi:hypothetical protein